MKRFAHRADEGFTLVELLIVIAILGVLAGIVVFAVGTTGAHANTNVCGADAKTVETALEVYKQQMGTYPGDLSLLKPNYLRDTPPPAEIEYDGVGGITAHCG